MKKQSKNKAVAIFEGVKKSAVFGMTKRNYGIFQWWMLLRR